MRACFSSCGIPRVPNDFGMVSSIPTACEKFEMSNGTGIHVEVSDNVKRRVGLTITLPESVDPRWTLTVNCCAIPR